MVSSRVDVVVVGAGFAGIYAAWKFRQHGLSVQVFEKAPSVGGTWFWNQYPGARCDVESMDYQYSFSDSLVSQWRWTERYPAAQEIVAYLNYVTDTFDLRNDMKFETVVTSASFDEATNSWTVRTDRSDVVTCTYVVWGTGCLSIPQQPSIEGLDSFQGETFITGLWPKDEPSFTGKRVAVVGTGSSAVQVIPEIAKEAAELVVFQRTANYVMPAFNRPLSDTERDARLASFQADRQKTRESIVGLHYDETGKAIAEISLEEANEILDERWEMGGLPMYAAFVDVIFNEESNKVPANYFAAKIREAVEDPQTAELLIPKGYAFGTKRLCVGTEYYETFNRENVQLVSISQNAIARVTPTGLELADGQVFDLDAIVFATGFDAVTGALLNVDISGREGHVLKEEWINGPATYLGIAVVGYPNMFLVTGPQSPSVFSNMVVSIEQHVDWIADAISANAGSVLEATPQAQSAWCEHVNEIANMTLHVNTDSWYMGSNVPGKPRAFLGYLGGVGPYRAKCDEVAAAGYDGFVVTTA